MFKNKQACKRIDRDESCPSATNVGCSFSAIFRVTELDTIYNHDSSQDSTSAKYLELALCSGHLEQSLTVAQNNLASLVLSDKADLLETIRLSIAHPPNLGGELVTRPHGRSKAGLEFLHVSGVATTKLPQDTVGSGVPAEQAVDDGSAEAHLLAGLRGGVQRIVVAVQPKFQTVSMLHGSRKECSVIPVQVGSLHVGLNNVDSIGLLTLGRREVDGRRTYTGGLVNLQ